MSIPLFAWTAPGANYPAYFNASRYGDEIVLTMREAPTVREGVYVCAHARDAGPGRCVAGGPTCNNYCNMAPDKGPMQDRPLPCTHTDEGKIVTIRLPLSAWPWATS